MGLNVHIIHGAEFIRTTRTGEMDLERTREGIATVAKAAAGAKGSPILSDWRAATPHLSPLEIWEVVQELQKHDVFAGRKIALLVSIGAEERAELFKLCAETKGYRVSVFHDFEHAIDWLFSRTELCTESKTESAGDRDKLKSERKDHPEIKEPNEPIERSRWTV